MATKTPAVPQLTLPGIKTLNNPGTPFSVYERGTDVYERLRIGGEVELVLDDGTTKKAVVQQLQVGALIDVISGFGNQAVYTAGRIYSPLSLVQALTDLYGGEVVDVTKLYTVVVVTMTAEIGQMGVVQPA